MGGVTAESAMQILCVNVGSSTVKGGRYVDEGGGPVLRRVAAVEGGSSSFDGLLDALGIGASDAPDVVCHRIVHGGPDRTEHALLTPAVRAQLDAALSFAPLHLPAELAVIDAMAARFPDATGVVCLDTAFHRTMSDVATTFALPARLRAGGIQRFGFHGLSYEYVVDRVGAGALGRAVIAHLGRGVSLAAVSDGRSQDTTMGLTPTGGVVMSSRSGDLDPGVLLHLLRRGDVTADELAHVLDHESGMFGLSGSSADMRVLLAERAQHPGAAMAVDVFCHSVRKAVGALAAVLGGIDSLVFTAGIGEHAPDVRSQICEGLGHLGVVLDSERNAADAAVISVDGAPVSVRVVATDENLMMARHAARLVAPGPAT